jgi:hypothetical protein
MAGDNTNGTVTTVSGPLTIRAVASNGGHFAGPTTSGYLNIATLVNVDSTGTEILIRLGNVRFSGGGNYPAVDVRAGTTSLGMNNGVASGALMDIGGNASPTVPARFDLNGFNQTLSGLKNTVTPANVGWITNSSGAQGTLTLNLGEGNAYSFEGGIVGNVALVLNSGSQTIGTNGSPISGLLTYTGNTLINGGTLTIGQDAVALPNSPIITVGSGAALDVSANPLTLGAAQTLKGNGTVVGSVTVNGTLAPGGSVGKLNLNNLMLGSGSTTLIELNKGASTNDQVACSGSLTYGGTLAVTNLSGTLNLNDQFTVFSAAIATGNFSSVTGTAGTGLAFSFNPTNGVVTVVSGMANYPTNITYSYNVSGSSLTLGWPESHRGWILQAQTNNLSTGLSSNWYDIAGSQSSTQAVMTVNPANPTVFYRLRHP